MNIPVATATEVAIPLTPTAQHTDTAGAVLTTVADGTDIDGIMMIGIMVDGVMADTSLLVDMADSPTAADSATAADSKGVVVAGARSRIQDMAAEAIAADPTGHRISRTIV
jgi:hypothetical protein